MSESRRARSGVFRRLGQVFQFRSTPRHVDREIEAEIGYHFSRQVDALVAAGMSRDDAIEEAHRRFGNVGEHRSRLGRIDRQRQAMETRAQWWEITRENIRYGLRGLRQSPGFTATVVLTLALGIGANTTMFGVIDRLLLTPPAAITDPDEVRRVYITRGFDRGDPFTSATMTHADFTDWAAAKAFDITAFQDRGITLGTGDAARRIRVAVAASNFFDLLGVTPRLGRFFTEQENAERATVVVIGHDMWMQDFDGDADVLGRRVFMGGVDLEVIGVGPPSFTGVNLERVDGWLPLRSPANPDDPASWESRRNYYWLRALARLRDSAGNAEAEATALHRAARADTDYDAEAFVTLAPLIAARGPRASDESRVARWLSGVSAVVLLIACANVANLLLARALRRRREIAVRLALGISRARLVAQLVTESVLLSILGGLCALAVAYWGAELMRTVLLPGVHWPGSPLGLRMLGFTFVASVCAGLISGVVPALQATGSNILGVMRAGERGGALGRSRTHRGLLLLQSALSALLLVGAGLFVRSLVEVRGLDLGIDPDPVALAIPEMAGGMSDEERTLFFRNAVERLEQLPSVESVAATASTPFQTSRSEPLRIPGREELPRLASGGPYIVAATPGIFSTLDLSILEGRGFLPHEDATTEPVAVVDETMARLVWPGESPLGKCLLIGSDDTPACNRVVGVVESSRRQELVEGEQMQYFVPLGQGVPATPETLLVRAAPDSLQGVMPAVRAELHASAVVRFAIVRPFRDYIDPQARAWQLGATMFTVFGGLALTIAAVGLYGVLAFGVVQRTHELGVRTALGATPGRLVGMVLIQATRLAALGVGAGLLAALVAADRMAPLLFNVSARDPLVFGTVAAALGLVSLLAASLPAWRTTRIDPNTAFRAD